MAMADTLLRPVRQVQHWLEAHPRVRMWLRVFRLSLFQFGMGLSLAPLTGTLNRVLINELGIAAFLVGSLLALHYFISPARAIFGYRSDIHRAAGRWRTPYLVLGAMLTYGGLATAPFSLILLSGEGFLPFPLAVIVCFAIFFAYGLGVNIAETIYLAIVSDVTPPQERGRVLSVLWVALVLGTIVGSLLIGELLLDYSHTRLIQVMQGSALAFVFLTFMSMLDQERLKPNGELVDFTPVRVRETLGESLRMLAAQRPLRNLFIVLALATTGFAVHDVLLEPYGGQVLGMTVAETTRLTAVWGGGMLTAIVLTGWLLWRGHSALRLLGSSTLLGILGFATISLSTTPDHVGQFLGGIALIGMGRGMLIVGGLSLVMGLCDRAHAGLFIALWGITQALAQGIGTISAGLARDVIGRMSGVVANGYIAVYLSALTLIAVAGAMLLILSWRGQLRAEQVRSPWSSLDQVNADQIIF
ncbi:MAG: MFS transporter [Chloroflexus sp.]|jgi:BCD family chlorophyll transporter-like MFS transporter|uniref:BCD family MFS transporter n=1 Tax=Chloroflexus sp. TaxID=1904827 RepID=UPI0021DBD8B5|nr:BCD family MFS transporter [Chloroflexus sp.]GIV87997.1 MAG: MFS transporter [Chloroflexus sp.]